MDEVSTYLAAWRETTDRLLRLSQQLKPDEWERDTDCPGWRVRDVFAHIVHIERVLADGATEPRQVGKREVDPDWTAAGVAQRKDDHPDALRAELASAVLLRSDQLHHVSEGDAATQPETTPAGVDWDWATLLRMRAIDIWVHEQDIRRAVDRPGGMTGVGAQVAVGSFERAMPYVLGKRVAAPPGTVVEWQIEGPVRVHLRVRVEASGRAVPVDDLAAQGDDEGGPTVLRMDTETFVVLAAGRRSVDDVSVDIEGDRELGRRVCASMGVTP